jgi:hypothetical protein
MIFSAFRLAVLIALSIPMLNALRAAVSFSKAFPVFWLLWKFLLKPVYLFYPVSFVGQV